MSSPIHRDNDTDPTSIYAPPWARRRIHPVAEPKPRSRVRTAATAKMRSGKLKPKFSGDRAMLALQRQLTLDPNLIPEPSSESAAVIRPLLIRFCSVTDSGRPCRLGSCILLRCEENRRNYSGGYLRPHNCEQPCQRHRHAAIAIAANRIADSRGAHPGRQVTAGCRRECRHRGDDVGACVCHSARSCGDLGDCVPHRRSAPMIAGLCDLTAKRSKILVKRGKDLLANGDLAAARLLLRRAAEAGSAEGALTLGTTFDPVVLQRLGAIGAAPDLAQARQWYQRAAELGSSAASQQLAGLADVR